MGLFDRFRDTQPAATATVPVSYARALEDYSEKVALEGWLEDQLRLDEDGTDYDYQNFGGDLAQAKEKLGTVVDKKPGMLSRPLRMSLKLNSLCVQWKKPVVDATALANELERLVKFFHDFEHSFLPVALKHLDRIKHELALPMSQLKADSTDPKLVEQFVKKQTVARSVPGMSHWLTKQREPDNKFGASCKASPNFLGLWFVADLHSGNPTLSPFLVALQFCRDEALRTTEGRVKSRLPRDEPLRPWNYEQVKAVLGAVEKADHARREALLGFKKLKDLADEMVPLGNQFTNTFPQWDQNPHSWQARTCRAQMQGHYQYISGGQLKFVFEQVDEALHVAVKMCLLSIKRMG